MAFHFLDLGIKLLLVVLAPIVSFFILSDSGRRRFSYVIDVHHNADILFSTMKLLEGKEEDLLNSTLAEAEAWKNQVQSLMIDVHNLKRDYQSWKQKVLLCKIWSTYGIAVRAGLLREKVELLHKENVQPDNLPPPPAVQKLDDVETVPDLEDLRDEALRYLVDKESRVIGIYGMGGVGKTTLLTMINNFLHWMLMVRPVSGNDAETQPPEEYKFHHVVWATATKDIVLKDLQEQVALGMGIPLSPASSMPQRAEVIRGYMKEKSFLLLLDDLWAFLDLRKLGIPNPEEPNVRFKRKLIFTTRSEKVCNSMQTQTKMKRRIKVQLLSDDSAWQLFTGTPNRSHDCISVIKDDVVKECGGLLYALTAIRDSISSRNSLREWEDARDMLMKSKPIQAINKVLRRLQHSYDSLNDNQMKKCFLCCVLWPKGVSIDQDELIRFWMGLELLDKYQVDDSYVKGREYLRELKGVGLLEACDNEDRNVKMHNMIRVMALQIVSKRYRWMVQAGLKLNEAPGNAEQWMEMHVVSLMVNNIITLPDFANSTSFPSLSTLMLQQNPLNQIPYCFFSRMPKLTCLDLSRNSLPVLPLDICHLEWLRYMNLSNAGIRSLPQEFWQLKTLRCLILRDIHELELSIPTATAIQMKLQELDLYGSSGAWQNTEENIFQRLRYLQVLKITVRSAQMLRNLSELSRVKLWRIGIEGTDNFTHLDLNQITEARRLQEHLQELTISSLSIPEVRNEWRTDILSKLRSLSISGCPNLSNISWVLQLRHLRDLRVCFCHQMTTLIETNTTTSSQDAWHLLNNLYLEDLPNLQGMNSWVSRFPYLKSIQATRCPKLGTLPPGWQEGNPIGSIQRYFKIQVGERRWSQPLTCLCLAYNT